jgi:predicted ribonuclease YlaK
VPLLVVDELDRLKRDNQARTRARMALKMLNDVFAHVSEDQTMSVLRGADDTSGPDGWLGLGPITTELLFDPPNHERLPDPDAEIVDRALAVQNLAGRPVTMVTYDINMALRARYSGLKVVSPPYPEQEDQARSARGHGTVGAARSTSNGTGQ